MTKQWIIESNELDVEASWWLTELLSRVGLPLAALAILYFLRGVII